LPVQFIIHHRRIIFVVSVIILPQSLSALIHLLQKNRYGLPEV
jgi:hypothetical protein